MGVSFSVEPIYAVFGAYVYVSENDTVPICVDRSTERRYLEHLADQPDPVAAIPAFAAYAELDPEGRARAIATFIAEQAGISDPVFENIWRFTFYECDCCGRPFDEGDEGWKVHVDNGFIDAFRCPDCVDDHIALETLIDSVTVEGMAVDEMGLRIPVRKHMPLSRSYDLVVRSHRDPEFVSLMTLPPETEQAYYDKLFETFSSTPDGVLEINGYNATSEEERAERVTLQMCAWMMKSRGEIDAEPEDFYVESIRPAD